MTDIARPDTAAQPSAALLAMVQALAKQHAREDHAREMVRQQEIRAK